MTPTSSLLRDFEPPAASSRAASPFGGLDVSLVRAHFAFAETPRIVTNNAASTQSPRELVSLLQTLVPEYENVHRGQSAASRRMSALLDDAYTTLAQFLNAPSSRGIVFCRNTTEAINTVMYSLMGELRSGDNVVTTLMEHNSNYVPWYGMCREILPRFGVKVECRLARFDASGRLDLEHLARLVDERTKLVSVTGASNFFGTKTPLHAVRALARNSGYVQPSGQFGSLFVVDGAQLAPSSPIDVQALDVDYFAFSLHKMLAPYGVGVLYAKEALLAASRPFLYGGDMIADGQVSPERVEYNALPWKYSAGTPNILGCIVSAEAVRLLLDLALSPERSHYFGSRTPLERVDVERALGRIGEHTRSLTARALEQLRSIPGLTLYGPSLASERTPLVAFNVAGRNPLELADALAARGVEGRAGCHCATLAHRELGLDPPASLRLSFYLYNTKNEVDAAIDALRQALAEAPQSRAAGD
ncbi:MAG TPA: aminotransferase class V-fold PLP-dependent enzyme [Polyangiaceae bacterium]|jgi:cysteine desulfurase/selenocysteine lyase|nr:aminotransferase class V-fold PLP-dependent enzyme [Polyangiaceae bacterium]